jgi:hypothetical protein
VPARIRPQKKPNVVTYKTLVGGLRMEGDDAAAESVMSTPWCCEWKISEIFKIDGPNLGDSAR